MEKNLKNNLVNFAHMTKEFLCFGILNLLRKIRKEEQALLITKILNTTTSITSTNATTTNNLKAFTIRNKN
jgi:hypothetical protein